MYANTLSACPAGLQAFSISLLDIHTSMYIISRSAHMSSVSCASVFDVDVCLYKMSIISKPGHAFIALGESIIC